MLLENMIVTHVIEGQSNLAIKQVIIFVFTKRKEILKDIWDNSKSYLHNILTLITLSAHIMNSKRCTLFVVRHFSCVFLRKKVENEID